MKPISKLDFAVAVYFERLPKGRVNDIRGAYSALSKEVALRLGSDPHSVRTAIWSIRKGHWNPTDASQVAVLLCDLLGVSMSDLQSRPPRGQGKRGPDKQKRKPGSGLRKRLDKQANATDTQNVEDATTETPPVEVGEAD